MSIDISPPLGNCSMACRAIGEIWELICLIRGLVY
ncbi:hypothetical protein SPLC1_S082420 [Arthrospira platensis C1]|nr:hypothetical protein SPLC1_S082420 [Arthrospira platensis C1]